MAVTCFGRPVALLAEQRKAIKRRPQATSLPVPALQSVYRRASDGSLTMLPRLATVTTEALLAAQTEWSKRLNDILRLATETE